MVQSQTLEIVSKIKEVSKATKTKIPLGCYRRLKSILGDLEGCRMPLPNMVTSERPNTSIVCVWQLQGRELQLEVPPTGPLPFRSVRFLEGTGVQTGEGAIPKINNVDSLMAWLLTDQSAEA
jgi:hypothetical protein